MGSIEKERAILKELCDRIREEELLKTVSVSPDNVFSIFDVIRKEVPYCRVLLYLIQNNWKSFEEEVLNGCCGGQQLYMNTAQTEYVCEAPCLNYDKSGRIDIFLETENHVIAMEAKLDALDQEHQLVRYQKELKRTYPENKEIHIVYLTKNGKPASENSLQCQCAIETCKVKDYKRISFREDIYRWVSNIAETENDIARQFLEVLELENVSTEKQVLLLKENKENLEVVRALSGALPLLWEEIKNAFLTALSEEMIKTYTFTKKKTGVETHKSEVWAVSLIKENKELHFCYETNFFLRTGQGDSRWAYVAKSAFETNQNGPICTVRKKEAFYFKGFDSSNDGLIAWFYEPNEEKKQQVIARIAASANEFFKKPNTN